MLLAVVVFYACLVALSCEPDKRVITSLKYSNYRVQLTVVNGLPAETSQVPHLVSIKEPLARRGRNTLWGNLCGASIISHDGKLLTAAHCFESNKFLYAKRPYILRAVHGSTKTDIECEGKPGISKKGVQWRKIKRAVLHNNFYFPHNDIAIAFLDTPWTYSIGVAPIALETGSADNLGQCYLAGYGRTGHGPMDRTSEVLLIAKVETIPRAMCSELWGMRMDAYVCTSSMRADAGDASEGDSGGPLWCERRGRRHLAGVVSGKGIDLTTLFTRVSEYNQWIQSDGRATSRATNNRIKFAEFPYSFPYVFVLFILSIELNI